MGVLKWKKECIDRMERCYSVQTAIVENKLTLLVASEAENGGLMAYDVVDDRVCEKISQTIGGVMTIVDVPEKQDVFYVSRNFYPHFQAQNSELVCYRKINSKWYERVVLQLPYLHRFDIFLVDHQYVFLGCTLCTSKREPDDWSDPGGIYVGYLQDDPSEPFSVVPFQMGLLKNHGYWRGIWKGKEAGFIATENGVYVFLPGKTLDECKCVKIFEHPASEVALWDFDGDGIDEMVMISPMHGSQLSVFHEDMDGTYKEVYRCSLELEFCHALWAGEFQGYPMVLCGSRRKDKILFAVMWKNGTYEIELIDTQVGSANVCVYTYEGKQKILSANNGCHEIALYSIEE